jgi:hypothetical protein
MSHHDYTVIAPGHMHAGKALEVGATVHLRDEQAARFPAVFKRTEPSKADRPARATTSANPGRSAKAERPTVHTANEE